MTSRLDGAPTGLAGSLPVSRSSSRRAEGTAFFVAAVLVIGAFATATLDRVGAPEGFVRALGPALALAVSAGAGLAARNADLPSFLAAGRRVGAPYGGLALVALVCGLTFCLYGPDPAAGDPPWQATAFGVGAGAFVLGPFLRRFGATWRSDVIATRFPAWPVRLLSGLAIFVAAALTAYAGFRGATDVVGRLLAPDRASAEIIVAAALFLSAIPGGLAGLVAAACACAGAVIAMAGAAVILRGGFVPPASLWPGAASADLATLAAAAAAAGGFFALDAPAIASRSPRVARRGARRAFVLCVLLAAALFGVAPRASDIPVSEAAIDSLIGGAALAACLALASVGLHGSSRAFGLALGAPPRPFRALASVRLARMRGAQILVLAGCVAADALLAVEPRTALVAAMALSLAFTIPLLALALFRDAGSISAGAALAAGLAALVYRREAILRPESAGALLSVALAAAAAAFAVGALVSIVMPSRAQPARPGADPFSDRSGG